MVLKVVCFIENDSGESDIYQGCRVFANDIVIDDCPSDKTEGWHVRLRANYNNTMFHIVLTGHGIDISDSAVIQGV